MEALEPLARAAGCEKLVEVEETGECLLLYCKGGSPPLLIALSRYDGWLYLKAVPEQLVPAYMWHCSDIFYNPYGQYAFARSVEELAERLKSKRRLLLAQLRLGLERRAAQA
ncbi:MAG: hypothetical protein GXO15_00010 [Crenarchaeota archaeon]|nr:hypothetical protein [Thermoproteota archaeon]